MKSRLSYLLAGIAVVLVSLALWFRNVTIPCGIRPEPGVRESVEIFHWLDAWSLDHDGELPARLEDLLTADLGAEESCLQRVIEFPGAGKKLNSLAKDFVILRCRAGRRDELEARVHADGSARAFKR